MELVRPLDGLDSHPWSAFSHAYVSADDLPDLLRALVGADAAAADEALSQLYGGVLHQGTVYAASAESVPFLARIAVAGHRTADILSGVGRPARYPGGRSCPCAACGTRRRGRRRGYARAGRGHRDRRGPVAHHG
ncbi:hypothetical protein [Streptomyces sp. NPDC059928]|uniref:hypothetical protein n=1 Tax=unclassified Streptomyces TaxID=2593676 RepID=UPI0036600C17